MATTLGALWRAGRDHLVAAGIDGAARDARLLAELALGLDAVQLSTRERDVAPQDAVKRFETLIAQRASGVPVARLRNEQWFYGRAFHLSTETLVPRPETEALVDLALELPKAPAALRFLDLGTGTGCIAISIAAGLPLSTGVATDVNPAALRTAFRNAERHGVIDRLKFLEGSWFAALDESERFDLIVSNPPYIRHEVIGELAIEVRKHDPLLALDGGADGLVAYRHIVSQAPRRLQSDGVLAVEIGHDQGETVSGLFADAGFSEVVTKKDLAGLDRLVVGKHL